MLSVLVLRAGMLKRGLGLLDRGFKYYSRNQKNREVALCGATHAYEAELIANEGMGSTRIESRSISAETDRCSKKTEITRR
jgi:hypothetical protein